MKKLLATAIGLLLLAGCGASPTSETKGDNTGETASAAGQAAETPSTDPGQAPTEDGITATFKVTTTSKASVSWGTGSGMSQDDIKKGEWSKKVKLDDGFDVATLTVTSSDLYKSQTVTCEILVNGVSKAKNKAKGKMATATCNANTAE